MFSVVKYRAVDYCYEETVRHKLIMNLLMLPVPVTLAGTVQEKAYRTPWAYGSLRSSCQLEVSGSVLDDLKADLGLLDSLERFGACVENVEGVAVPSSNPASHRPLESEEALWLLHGEQSAAELDGWWLEKFSAADAHLARCNYEDLYLPEEVIISDNLLKSNLPSLLTLVKRLQTLPVSDPLELHRSGSVLSELLSFSQHAPYEASSSSSVTATQTVIEEFRKEPILDAECLMLPAGIETNVLRKKDFVMSVTNLQGALTLAPEPPEDQTSVLETLGKIVPCVSECETFSHSGFDIIVCKKANSPVPFISCAELETELLVSPPHHQVLLELSLSTGHLSAEPLSPLHKQCLLTDSECDVLEKAVRMAEKHRQFVSGLLLTEPLISEPALRRHSLSELLSLMNPERGGSDTTWAPLNPGLLQVLTVERHSALESHQTKTDQMKIEEFGLMCLTQISSWPVKPGASAANERSSDAAVRKRKTVRFALDESHKRRRKIQAEKRRLALLKKRRKRSAKDSPDSVYETVVRSIRLQNAAAAEQASGSSRLSLKLPAKPEPGVPYSVKMLHSASLQNPAPPRHSVKYPGNSPVQFTYSVSLSRTETDRLRSGPNPATGSTENTQRESIYENAGASERDANPAAYVHPTREESNPFDAFHPESVPSVPNCNVTQTNQSHLNQPEGYRSLSKPEPAQASCCNSPQAVHKDAAPSTSKAFTLAEQNLGTTPKMAHTGQERALKTSTGGRPSAIESLDFMDPLTSFIMLRSFKGSPALLKPEQTPQRLTGIVNTEMQRRSERPVQPESRVKATSQQLHTNASTATSRKSETKPKSDSAVTAQPRQISEIKKCAQAGVPERAVCAIVHVPATDTERGAYWELQALGRPVLRRVHGSGSSVLRSVDFSSLTSEQTDFSIKQQERLLSTGRVRENEFKDLALLHILTMVKETLLGCDLNAATDYLAEAHAACKIGGLKGLLRKFQVLLYLSSKWAEPRYRIRAVQEKIGVWLQRNPNGRVLVVTPGESVGVELVTALRQTPGNSVTTILSDQSRRIDNNTLEDSRCAVVCVQLVGSEFPWWMFSAVFELHGSGQSPIRGMSMKNKLSYTCFTTAMAHTDSPVVSSPLDHVPFLLFVTEGLLKRSDLLQLLESTYNMTLLERSHPLSLQALGGTHLYDIITVDANTAVLLQEVGELEQDRASERVVLRLLALSLQFSRCWVILYCTDHHSALVRGNVFSSLGLIYSAFVILGNKSGGLDVKVLLVSDVAELGRCVYQICLHTLLCSERDVRSWLDRDWFSVLPTQEEQFLLRFPSVNCVAAQLMLSRAPSLQWLLDASHTQLRETFPHITHTVCKLFSDATAARRRVIAPDSAHMTRDPHWGLDTDEAQPHSDPFLSCSSTPGFINGGWFGAESEWAEIPTQLWRGESKIDQGYTDRFSGGRGGDEQWALPAWSSLANPGLPFTQTHAFTRDTRASEPCPQRCSWVHPTPPFLPIQAQQRWAQHTESYSDTARKRPAGGAVHTAFPQCKRGKLLFERVPGRTDGQTRLRFF